MVCGLLFLSPLLNTMTQSVDFKGRVVLFNTLRKSLTSASKLSDHHVNADVRIGGGPIIQGLPSPVYSKYLHEIDQKLDFGMGDPSADCPPLATRCCCISRKEHLHHHSSHGRKFSALSISSVHSFIHSCC